MHFKTSENIEYIKKRSEFKEVIDLYTELWQLIFKSW